MSWRSTHSDRPPTRGHNDPVAVDGPSSSKWLVRAHHYWAANLQQVVDGTAAIKSSWLNHPTGQSSVLNHHRQSCHWFRFPRWKTRVEYANFKRREGQIWLLDMISFARRRRGKIRWMITIYSPSLSFSRLVDRISIQWSHVVTCFHVCFAVHLFPFDFVSNRLFINSIVGLNHNRESATSYNLLSCFALPFDFVVAIMQPKFAVLYLHFVIYDYHYDDHLVCKARWATTTSGELTCEFLWSNASRSTCQSSRMPLQARHRQKVELDLVWH